VLDERGARRGVKRLEPHVGIDAVVEILAVTDKLRQFVLTKQDQVQKFLLWDLKI
jgi:hypothetical protein